MKAKLILFSFLFFSLLGSDAFSESSESNDNATSSHRSLVSLEGNLTWQTRNDVRIPGNSGTLLSLDQFDSGPFPTFRIYVGHLWNNKHELRLLYAPLGVTVEGLLAQPASFQGATFASATATTAFYQFNSYRATYAYHFDPLGAWRFALGFTAKIRDAEIRLTQGALSATKKNVGFVPLLNLQAATDLGAGWTFRFDLDGLAAPQGRAFDAALFLENRIRERDSGCSLSLFAGYRTIEGGAGNDEVFTFAWIHNAVLGVRTEF
jgi:hypothetical protein